MDDSGWPKIPINNPRLKIVRIGGIILCFTQVILQIWLYAQILILYLTVGDILPDNSNISHLLKNLLLQSIMGGLMILITFTLLLTSFNKCKRLKKSVYKGWSVILWTYACLLFFSILLVKQVFEKVDDDLTDILWKGLHEYSQRIYWSERIDKVQKTLSCCGVNSPDDWLQTNWMSQTNKVLQNRSSRIDADVKQVPMSCCLIAKPAPCCLEAEHIEVIGLEEEPSNLAYESGCTQVLAHHISTFSRTCIINLTLIITNVIFGWLIQRILINFKEGIKDMEGFEYTWIFSPLPSWFFGKKIKSISSQEGFIKKYIFNNEVKEFKLIQKLSKEWVFKDNEEKKRKTKKPSEPFSLLINLKDDIEMSKSEYDICAENAYDKGKTVFPHTSNRSAADYGYYDLGFNIEKVKHTKAKPRNRLFARRDIKRVNLTNSSSDSDNFTNDSILVKLETAKHHSEPILHKVKKKLQNTKSVLDENEIKNQQVKRSSEIFNEIASSSYEMNTSSVDFFKKQPSISNLSKKPKILYNRCKDLSLNKTRRVNTLKSIAISKYIPSYLKGIVRTYFSKHERKFKDNNVLIQEITKLIPETELYENKSFKNSEEILENQESIGYDEEELEILLDELFDNHAEINLMNLDDSHDEGSSKLNTIINYVEEQQLKTILMSNYGCEEQSKVSPLIDYYGGGDGQVMSLAKKNNINNQDQMEIFPAAQCSDVKNVRMSYLSNFGGEHSQKKTVGSQDHNFSNIMGPNHCCDNILRPFVLKPFSTGKKIITRSPIDNNIDEETNYGLDYKEDKEKEANIHENMDTLEDHQDADFHENMDIDNRVSEVSENSSINLLNQDFQVSSSTIYRNSKFGYCFPSENRNNADSDFPEDFVSISSNEDETQIPPWRYENPFGQIKSEFDSKNLLEHIRKERQKEIQNKSTPHVNKLIEKFNIYHGEL